MLLIVAVVHLLAPRLQVDGRDAPRRCARRGRRWPSALLAGAVQAAGACASGAYPAPRGRAKTPLYVTSGDGRPAPDSRRYNALAADLYWIRAIQYYGGTKRRLAEQHVGPAPPPLLAAVATTEYRLLYPLLDLTTTLDPLFNIAYRFGAIFLAEAVSRRRRPCRIWRSRCSKRDCALDPISGSTCRTSGSCTTGGATTTRRRPTWFDKAGEVPGAPVVAAVAGGDDARARGAIGSRRGTMWEAIRAVGRDRLAAATTPSGGSLQLRRARRDRRAADRSSTRFARETGSPPATGRPSLARGRDSRRPGRSRPARRTSSTPDGRVDGCRGRRRCFRCRTSRSGSGAAARDATGAPRRSSPALFGALVGSFLNVCIYRLPRGTSIVWPASACPQLRRARCRGSRTFPVVELRWCSAAAAARAARRSRVAVPDRRGADGR